MSFPRFTSLARVGALAVIGGMLAGTAGPASASAYDDAVLSDRPVLYLPLGGASGLTDQSGHGHHAAAHHGPAATGFPDGGGALAFDGVDQYVEVDDSNDLSVSTTGALTLEAWMRPDVLDFPHPESPTTPYVHFIGKSSPGKAEYAARMYSYHADWAGDGIDPPRPNRISGYAFNLSGGLGAGSYFQDSVSIGQWIHYVLVINANKTSSKYPTGYTKIYKDGVLRDQDSLQDYQIVPRNGSAPLRIGSSSLDGFFEGALAKVAVYKRELPAKDVLRHFRAVAP